MKFTSLTLRNWRPFHGTHRIDFSTDVNKPVTLVLGPNGAGKTALLNAFTWALYGLFTEGFQRPESLVNFEALKGDPAAETYVELELEHDDKKYTVRRSTDGLRQGVAEYELRVTKDGELAVEDDIYRILPKALKDLFFFPAETFTTASVLQGDRPGEGASLDIGSAIRSLLAGDIYDHAVEDLRDAMQSDALRPSQKYTDDTVEAARLAWEQAQAELKDAEKRREGLPSLLATARDQASKAKREAEKYNPEEIKKWEEEYNRLKNKLTEAELAVQRAHELYEQLARKAYLHFGMNATESAVRRLDIAEKAGLMPPRIHDSVLHKSLEDGRCALCHVTFNVDARDRVEKLLEHVTEHAVAVLGLETRTQLRTHLDRAGRDISELRERVAALAEELTIPGPPQDTDMKMLQSAVRMCIDVADRMVTKAKREFTEFSETQEQPISAEGNSPVDIAMMMQKKVDVLEQESRTIVARIAKCGEVERDKLSDYTKKSSKSDGYKRKTAAIEVLREVKDFFDEARRGLNQFGREDFQNAINNTYSDLIAKPYEIRVGDDFGISVSAPGNDEVMPLSQSEKVLLLIAFLGAIARLAPQYAEIARQNQQLQRTGAVSTSREIGFPVVLDSPTSPLDVQYEADVINCLPKLLPQIVIIVSAKSVEAWEKISPSIGSTNVMELTSHKTTTCTVRWGGRDHTYGTQDDGVEPARTRITAIG